MNIFKQLFSVSDEVLHEITYFAEHGYFHVAAQQHVLIWNVSNNKVYLLFTTKAENKKFFKLDEHLVNLQEKLSV